MPIFTPENLASAYKGIKLEREALQEEKNDVHKLFKFLPAIGQGADLATSLGTPQLREVNGLMSDPKVMIPSKIGAGVLLGLLVDKAAKKSPKAAKILSGAFSAGGFIPALSNIYQARKNK